MSFAALEARMLSLEKKIDVLIGDAAGRRKKAAARRKQYKTLVRKREEGKLALPPYSLLKRRDPRLADHLPTMVKGARAFLKEDDPEGFFTWLVYYWNCCVYLKKPITFSGGYYRVHIGDVRHPYGAFDLMGYNKKQKHRLKDDAELDDFSKRPWWRWAYLVLLPVWEELRTEDAVPVRFAKCVRVVLGGYGEYEVYDGAFWDANEERKDVNRMLVRVGGDLWRMWQACIRGLRTREPIPLPQKKVSKPGAFSGETRHD